MQCVYYKFSSKLDHSMVTFHGNYITLHELKKNIMAQERIKPKKDDLHITNADTHEEYTDDEAQIETYTFVIVRRIPIGGAKPAGRKFFGAGTAVAGPSRPDESVEAPKRVKMSKGIPLCFMVNTEFGTNGAMLTCTGEYMIPAINAQAYAQGKKEPPPFLPRDQSSSEDDSGGIPDELLCPICDHVMQYAAVTPCCGDSYCDDCIRTALLDSEEHTCLKCGEPNVSPDSLEANKALRQLIENISMGDGWVHKRKKVRHAATASVTQPPPAPTVYLPPRAHLGPSLSQPPLSNEDINRRRHRQDKSSPNQEVFTKDFFPRKRQRPS